MKWWLTQVAPFVVIIVYSLYYVVTFMRLRGTAASPITNNNNKAWAHFVHDALQTLSFFYFSIAQNTLTVFDCQFNGVTTVLSKEPSVECTLDNQTYRKVFVPAIVYCAIYIAGFPLLCFLLLHRNRDEIKRLQSEKKRRMTDASITTDEADSDVEISYRFLYNHYKGKVRKFLYGFLLFK